MKTFRRFFGKIYPSDETPNYGVYRTAALLKYGDRAGAVSHHWGLNAAQLACQAEIERSGEECEVVQYEHEN